MPPSQKLCWWKPGSACRQMEDEMESDTGNGGPGSPASQHSRPFLLLTASCMCNKEVSDFFLLQHLTSPLLDSLRSYGHRHPGVVSASAVSIVANLKRTRTLERARR